MATRQIPPSSNPFAVGAVVLDSAPYTDYFLRQEAEKKAKEEAYNKYFQDLENTLSPTGMDMENDLPALEVMKQQWRNHYLNNRDLIRTKKDGGKAYVENMRLFGDMKNLIEQSKQKVGQIKEFDVYRRQNPDAIIDDEFMMQVDRTRQPIKKVGAVALPGLSKATQVVVDNPNWGTIDFSRFQPVKPLTIEEEAKFSKDLVSGLKPSVLSQSKSIDPDDKFYDIKKTVYGFTPDQLEAVGSRAASQYETNRRIKITANQMKPTKEELASLNEYFNLVYKRPIEDSRDVFVARKIMEAAAPQEEIKREENKERAAQLQEAKDRRMAQYRQGLSDRSAAYRKALEGNEANSWLEGQMQYLESHPTATWNYIPKGGGEGFPLKVIGVDAPVRQRLAEDGKTPPDVVVQLPDGKFQGMYFKRGANEAIEKNKSGQFVIDEDRIPITLTREQMKTVVGDVLASGKELTSQLGGTAPQPATKPKKGKKLY